MANKVGYQGLIYYGTAGTTASTLLTNVEDLNYDTEQERVETTTRGDSTAIPKKVEDVVALGCTITWSMFNKTTDNELIALIAAARTGTAVALRTKSWASGLGFDGGLGGEQVRFASDDDLEWFAFHQREVARHAVDPGADELLLLRVVTVVAGTVIRHAAELAVELREHPELADGRDRLARRRRHRLRGRIVEVRDRSLPVAEPGQELLVLLSGLRHLHFLQRRDERGREQRA